MPGSQPVSPTNPAAGRRDTPQQQQQQPPCRAAHGSGSTQQQQRQQQQQQRQLAGRLGGPASWLPHDSEGCSEVPVPGRRLWVPLGGHHPCAGAALAVLFAGCRICWLLLFIPMQLGWLLFSECYMW